MKASLTILFLSSIITPAVSSQLVSVGDEKQLATPNCFDAAFMTYGGCSSSLIAIEVSDEVIAIANCYLVGQLSHLGERAIECDSSQKTCLQGLSTKQKELLIFVMNNIGVYCDSYTFRKSLFLKNKFIGALQETSEIVKTTFEQAIKAHDEMVLSFEAVLVEVKNMSNESLDNASTTALLSQTDMLLKEVEKMDSSLIRSPLDIRYVASSIDLYTYLFSFFLKVLFLLIHSALISSRPLDIPLSSLIFDLLAGTILDICIKQLSEFAPIYMAVPSSWLMSFRLILFIYFGLWRFIGLALNSSRVIDAEEHLIQSIGMTLKAILRDEHYTYRRYHSRNSEQGNSSAKGKEHRKSTTTPCENLLPDSFEYDFARRSGSHQHPPQIREYNPGIVCESIDTSSTKLDIFHGSSLKRTPTK